MSCPGRTHALSRSSTAGGPRSKSSLSIGHLQAMKSYSSGSSRDHQPSRSFTSRERAAWYRLSHALPVLTLLPVPLFPPALQVGRAGRLGDVGQGDGTAPPASGPHSAKPCSASVRSAAEAADADSRAARATSAPRAAS